MNNIPGSIKQIAAALMAFQAEASNISKDAENPHFKSRFATLDATIESTRANLAKHGLSYTQTCESDPSGPILVTTLMHSSGEYIISRMPLLLIKQDMQSFGSAWSYGRRYALQAILGLAATDDDGNEASTAPKSEFPKPAGKMADGRQITQVTGPKSNSGTFIIPFGAKWKGMKIQDADLHELENFIKWCEDKNSSDGKKPTPMLIELRKNFDLFCATAPTMSSELDEALDRNINQMRIEAQGHGQLTSNTPIWDDEK